MVGCVLEIMGEERSFSLEKARPLLRVKEQRGDAPPVFFPHAMRLLKLKRVAKPHRFGQQVMIYARIRVRNGYIPAVNKKGLVLQSFQKKV
jgi:hypothetical protein